MRYVFTFKKLAITIVITCIFLSISFPVFGVDIGSEPDPTRDLESSCRGPFYAEIRARFFEDELNYEGSKILPVYDVGEWMTFADVLTDYDERYDNISYDFNLLDNEDKLFCSGRGTVVEVQIKHKRYRNHTIGEIRDQDKCADLDDDRLTEYISDWIRVGYCYGNDFYPDGTFSSNACDSSLRHLHMDTAGANFVPHNPESPGRNVNDLANWIVGNFPEYPCCGDSFDGLGSVFYDERGSYQTSFVCTASQDGRFGWVDYESGIGVYDVVFDFDHWVFGYDSHGNWFDDNVGDFSRIAWEEETDYTKGTAWSEGTDKDSNQYTNSDQFSFVVATTGTDTLIACSPNNNFGDNLPEDGDKGVKRLTVGDSHSISGSDFNVDYLCGYGTKIIVDEIERDLEIVQDNEKSDYIIALCGGKDANLDNYNDQSGDDSNSRLLEPGDYVYVGSKDNDFDEEYIFYCTDNNGFVSHKDISGFDDEFMGANSGLGDFACEDVQLDFTFYHSYSLLDRFWRTSRACCGPGRLDGNFALFEDVTRIRDLDGVQRACWNDIAIPSGATIAYTDVTNFYNDFQSVSVPRPYNLLRVGTRPFPVVDDEQVVRNWWYDRDTVGDYMVDIFASGDAIDLIGYTYIEHDDYVSVNIKSMFPFHLQEGIPYHFVLVTDERGSEIINSSNSEFNIKGPDDYVVEFEVSYDYFMFNEEIDSRLLDENDFAYEIMYYEVNVEKSGEYILEINIDKFEEEFAQGITKTLPIRKIILVPRPIVLSYQGNFLACQDKNLGNPLPEVESTVTENNIFVGDKLISHCVDERGGHVCSPEGVWIDSSDESGNTRNTFSSSPNLIEDSSFNKGGPISFNGCQLIDNDVGVSPPELEAQNTFRLNQKYLSCTDINEQHKFRNVDGSELNYDEEYIFSAWIRGTGSISFMENDVAVDIIDASENWERVEIRGNQIEGDVTILFSGSIDIDGLQLEEKSIGQYERGNYFPTNMQSYCCAETACWDGQKCVSADDLSIDEHLTYVKFGTHMGQKGYVCLGRGDFEFAEKSYRWIDHNSFDFEDSTRDKQLAEGELITFLSDPSVNEEQYLPEHGFCEIGSCYVGRHRDVESPTRSHINRVDCIPGADSFSTVSKENEFKGRYCVDGDWITAVPYVASYLDDLGNRLGNGLYSLYCGDYHDVLNYYEYRFDTNEYHDIFGQSVAAMLQRLTHGNYMPIRFADKACALKYGSGNPNNIIAIPLNHNPLGTESPLGQNDLNQYFSDDLQITSAFKYFGIEDGGACSNIIGSDTNIFQRCGFGVFYNPKYNVILYSHSTASFDSIIGGSLPLIISFENDVSQTSNMFLENLDIIDDGENVVWAFGNHTRFDDVFKFSSRNKNMLITRQKLMDVREIEREYFEYLVMGNLDGFRVAENFTDIRSPLNFSEKVSVSDIFNKPPISYVIESGDSFKFFSLNDYTESDLFRNWYVYTGRLRGELELPPRD